MTDALKVETNPYARHANNPETFKQLKERGKLLYRDCVYIRVGGNIQISDDEPSLEAADYKITQSLCSLYYKEK